MLRTISPITTSVAARIPTDNNFFADTKISSVGISLGNYIKTSGTVAQTDEMIGFAKQPGNCAVQTNGTFTDLSTYSANANLSIAADPDDATKLCWLLRVASTDADTAGAGSKRTEFAAYPSGDSAIHNETPFLFGIATRLAESWAGTKDQQVICQVHPSVGVSPAFSLIVRGDTIVVDCRYGITTSQIVLEPYTSPIGATWDKWVVSGMFHATGGYLVVYRNGTKVVDYKGPFGYSDNTLAGYIKCGIYHWSYNNDWDSMLLNRGIYIKGFWLVDVKTVSQADLLDFLSSV